MRRQDLNLRSPDYEPGEITVSLQRKRVNPAAGSPTGYLVTTSLQLPNKSWSSRTLSNILRNNGKVHGFDPQNMNNPQRLPFHSASRA